MDNLLTRVSCLEVWTFLQVPELTASLASRVILMSSLLSRTESPISHDYSSKPRKGECPSHRGLHGTMLLGRGFTLTLLSLSGGYQFPTDDFRSVLVPSLFQTLQSLCTIQIKDVSIGNLAVPLSRSFNTDITTSIIKTESRP